MTIKNKLIYIDSQFTKELPSADEKIDSIFVSGYASVNVPDRVGDVIPSSVWEEGIKSYLKNPIVLAYHDHDDPVGRVVEHKIDNKGLWIKARISAAAEVFNLVKDGVLTAFSVGFKVLDAEYKPDAELFIIKKLELMEISIVSVPCNQDALFSLSKSFDNEQEYKNFKLQFVPVTESAKGLESSTETKSLTTKEFRMDPKELEQKLAEAAEKAAIAAVDVFNKKLAEEKAAKEKAEAEEAALQDRINKALALVTPTKTGTDDLLKELEKKVSEAVEKAANEQKAAMEEISAKLKEKEAELAAIQRSKMSFKDNPGDIITISEKEAAVLLSKITQKSVEDTKFGKGLLEKALGAGSATGAHLPSQTWEHEVSLNMEAEVRRRLVMAPLFRQISMPTNVMSIPINPEATYGTWIQNSEFGTTTSPGAASTHQLKEITLNAYKLATREYVGYEEEEDSLIVLLPIIRDAMIRRNAKSLDLALLRGAGAGADPVKGVATYDATSAVTATNTGAVTVANLVSLRKDLGAWGLDPSDVIFVVSTDVYYDLLSDTTFQTVDKIGVDRATLRTGTVGTVGNSQVLVSSEFPTKAGGSTSATTNYAAVAIAAGNFVVGNQRGLRFDVQDLVETQRRVLVSSLRIGMTQITTNLGQGVSVLRWT